MLSVPSCKWSRSLGGEYVDGASCIYAVFIRCIPGALGKGGDAFGDTVSDPSWYFYLSTVIVYKNHITVMDATGGGIFRVDPEFCGSSLRSPRLLSWTVWVRHLLCQPDNCNGKRFVSGSSGPSGGATYRGIGGIKSFIGVFHNLVENSSIFPLGVGNG